MRWKAEFDIQRGHSRNVIKSYHDIYLTKSTDAIKMAYHSADIEEKIAGKEK